MEVRTQLNRLRAFLGTDRSILLLCIGLAFLIWLFTRLSQPFVNERDVTIDYVVPEKRILAGNSPTEIIVKVEATGWEHIRNSLSRKPLNIKLTLDENKDFQSFSSLQIESEISKYLTSETKVATSSIPNIEVRMDDKAYKRIPVRLIESIRPAPQFKLTEPPTTTPDSVIVSGPQFIVEKLAYWETEKLEMSNLKEPVVATVKLRTHTLPTMEFMPAEVKCKINVEFFSEKSVEVPILVRNAPDSILYLINPRKVEVSFTAVKSIYDQITAQDFNATIDFASFDFSNAQPLPIVLKMPKGIDKVKMNQETAELFVNK